MSSSSDARLVRGEQSAGATALTMPELRSGRWTRLGDRTVLGDAVTEELLDGLAASAREAARAQGYAVGWAEGRRAAESASRAAVAAATDDARRQETRREAEHAAAMAALAAAADQLQARFEEVCRDVDGQAVDLVLELTRELVGQAATEAAEHVVRRVVGLLPDHPVVRVRLHPDVAATATDLHDQGVAVVADEDLGPADALVEADSHVVDLRVGTALARLREALA
jgi:flagellar assembly protein FliH